LAAHSGQSAPAGFVGVVDFRIEPVAQISELRVEQGEKFLVGQATQSSE